MTDTYSFASTCMPAGRFVAKLLLDFFVNKYDNKAMLHFAENHAAKPVFIVFSMFLILMTIVLTVAQTRQSQDIRSSAATELVNCTIGTNKTENDQDEKKLVSLINEYRKNKGLPELAFQEDLNRAAAWHSKDMADRTKLDHKDSSGRMDTERIKNCGYNAPTQQTAENVALWPDAEKVFTEWKKSDGHNKNMLCAACVHIGLAREKGANNKWYWTMDVGVQGSSTVATATPIVTMPDEEISPTTTLTITPPEDEDASEEDEDNEDEGTLDEGTSVEEDAQQSLTPAPQTLPDGTTGVLLQIQLPGIGDNGNTQPKHPTRQVTVYVANAKNEKLEEVNGTVTYSTEKKLFTGAIALPKVETNGAYLLRVKIPFSLSEIITSGFVSLEKGKLVTLPSMLLPVLDFNDNNTISVTDYYAFRDCMREKCRERKMDVNDDGKINILDHNSIVEFFSSLQGN